MVLVWPYELVHIFCWPGSCGGGRLHQIKKKRQNCRCAAAAEWKYVQLDIVQEKKSESAALSLLGKTAWQYVLLDLKHKAFGYWRRCSSESHDTADEGKVRDPRRTKQLHILRGKKIKPPKNKIGMCCWWERKEFGCMCFTWTSLLSCVYTNTVPSMRPTKNIDLLKPKGVLFKFKNNLA